MQNNTAYSCVANFSRRLFFVLSGAILLSGAAWGASSDKDCYDKITCGESPKKLNSKVGSSGSTENYECRVTDDGKDAVKYRVPLVGNDLTFTPPATVVPTVITENGVTNNGVTPPKKGKFYVGDGKCGTVFKKGPTGNFTQLMVQNYGLLGDPDGDPYTLSCGYSLRGLECLPPGG